MANKSNNIFTKILFFYLVIILTFAFSGCQGSDQENQPETDHVKDQSQVGSSDFSGLKIEYDGKLVDVDQIISGYLCDDLWNGKIYVDETVEVNPWEEDPIFFRDCSLIIEPGSVVYVAAHEGTVFYKGCSCHE